MKRLIHRYRRWKEWRPLTYYNKFQQILVLLGIMHSPSFESFLDWRYNK